MTVAEYVARFLAVQGVRHVFHLPGGMITPLLDAMARAGEPRLVGMHHEQAAGFAAEGWAKMMGYPGRRHGDLGTGRDEPLDLDRLGLLRLDAGRLPDRPGATARAEGRASGAAVGLSGDGHRRHGRAGDEAHGQDRRARRRAGRPADQPFGRLARGAPGRS